MRIILFLILFLLAPFCSFASGLDWLDPTKLGPTLKSLQGQNLSLDNTKPGPPAYNYDGGKVIRDVALWGSLLRMGKLTPYGRLAVPAALLVEQAYNKGLFDDSFFFHLMLGGLLILLFIQVMQAFFRSDLISTMTASIIKLLVMPNPLGNLLIQQHTCSVLSGWRLRLITSKILLHCFILIILVHIRIILMRMKRCMFRIKSWRYSTSYAY